MSGNCPYDLKNGSSLSRLWNPENPFVFTVFVRSIVFNLISILNSMSPFLPFLSPKSLIWVSLNPRNSRNKPFKRTFNYDKQWVQSICNSIIMQWPWFLFSTIIPGAELDFKEAKTSPVYFRFYSLTFTLIREFLGPSVKKPRIMVGDVTVGT